MRKQSEYKYTIKHSFIMVTERFLWK